MVRTIVEMFSYSFIIKAFVVGLLVSLSASLIGVSLVLKRFSMIGTGLSNVGFGALAMAMALNLAPLSVAIPVVLAAAFVLIRIGDKSRIRGDSAIALISTAALAIGVMAISVTTGMNTDVCNYMFGSILAMSNFDVMLSIILSIVVLIVFVLFYNRLFAVTFDEAFVRGIGAKVELYNTILAMLTAAVIVLGMRMMGAMLITSLIVFPALTSMRVFKRYSYVTISSAIISIICFVIGIWISYVYATPTGASIVIVNLGFFIGFALIGQLRKGVKL